MGQPSTEVTPLLRGDSVPTRLTQRRRCPVLVEPVAVLFLLVNGFIDSLRAQFLYSRFKKLVAEEEWGEGEGGGGGGGDHFTQAFHAFIEGGVGHGGPGCGNGSSSSSSGGGVTVEDKAQALTATWNAYLVMSKLIPMALATFFYGALSDKIGRKLCLLLPAIGFVLGVAVDLAVAYYDLPFQFMFLEVIELFFGGELVLKLGCSAHIVDSVVAGRRPFRMSLLDGLVFSSKAVSALAFGHFVKYTRGFVWPFFAIMCGNLVVVIYSTVMIPWQGPPPPTTTTTTAGTATPINASEEDLERQRPHQEPQRRQQQRRQQQQQQQQHGQQQEYSLREHLCGNFSSTIAVYTYNDGTGRRWQLLIVLAAYLVSALSGTGRVETLFQLGPPLCWSSNRIGTYDFIAYLFKALMMVVGTALLSRCLPPEWMAFIGRVSAGGQHLFIVFCTTTVMMFISPVIGSLGLLTVPMTKVLLTGLVNPSEKGRVLAVFSLAYILHFGSAIFMNPIYAETLKRVGAAAVFLLSFSLHFVSASLLLIYIWKKPRATEGSSQPDSNI